MSDTPAPTESLNPVVDPSAPDSNAPVISERKRLRNEAAKLVRVRVTCMNPLKKDWEGEIFCVGNGQIGSFKKFVPFNLDEGYHIPHIIYTEMKARMYQAFVTEKHSSGRKVKVGKLIREFGIEVLEPLTEVELKELAQRQAMANGTAN